MIKTLLIPELLLSLVYQIKGLKWKFLLSVKMRRNR